MKAIPRYKRLELLRLHRAGHKVADISKSLNVSRQTVVRWLQRLTDEDAKAKPAPPKVDEDLSINQQISDSFLLLNEALKQKLNRISNEDESGLFSKLVDIKLRKFSYLERQKIMYEIDSMYLKVYDSNYENDRSENLNEGRLKNVVSESQNKRRKGDLAMQ